MLENSVTISSSVRLESLAYVSWQCNRRAGGGAAPPPVRAVVSLVARRVSEGEHRLAFNPRLRVGLPNKVRTTGSLDRRTDDAARSLGSTVPSCSNASEQ